MWERSPAARLIWGVSLVVLLVGCGGAAISSGNPVFIAVFVLGVAIGLAQLLMAGPTQGRLWDATLTKVLYACVAFWALYVFGQAALETGAAYAVVPLILIVVLIAAQLLSLFQDRRSA